MIELSVSLASNGVVKVPGYEQLVRFGYTKNRGVYRLHVDATGEWEGLIIRAFWHLPGGSDPASSLVSDGSVDVPASVTAQPGNGCITFEGSDGTKTVTSADLRYRVSANSGTEDGTEPEPGTPAWQQLVDAVHTDATAAEQAKTDAQTAAQQAGAAAQKAGQALSDTVDAKEDALVAIGTAQETATQAVDTVRDKALKQVEASTKAADTAASQAAASAGNADRSAQAAAGSLQALKNGIASGDFKGEPGTSPTVTVQDITGGHRIVITDATGTSSVDVLNGKQGDPGKPGDTGATPELTIGTVEEGDAPSATITGTVKKPILNLTLKSGAPGKDATVDATLTQSGQAADAKATGDALATKAVIDDTTVGTDAWSSKHIVDMLCPPLEETGNPVQCYPVENYPLGVTASWEPTQEGEGTPYPAGGGPNLLDISQCTATVGKPYGVTITIDGDVFKVSGVPSSEVTEEGQYSFAVASCTQTELRGKGYKITPFALKGNVSSAWGLRTEDEDSLAIAAKLTPGVNTDIQLRLMVSKDTPAAYAPYENIRLIKGRDSVTVERCGENLVKYPYSSSSASRNGLVFTSQQDGSIVVNGTATVDTWFPFRWDIEKRLPINTPMTLSGCPAGGSSGSYYIGLYLGGKWFADMGNGNTDVKFTTREIASRVEVSIIKGTVCNNLTFYPKIEVGTTITPYSKYTGQTATLTIPSTIYGGTVDAVTGEGQETWKTLTLDGTEMWDKYGSVSEKAGASCFYFNIDDKDIGYGTSVCNKFVNTKNSNPFLNTNMKKFTYTDHPNIKNIYMNYGDDQTVPLDEWKAYLAAQYAAGTPVQIAYKLATPTPFTATGAQPIPALSGVNTVLTDANSVVVTGRADPIKRIIDLEDAVASMTNT